MPPRSPTTSTDSNNAADAVVVAPLAGTPARAPGTTELEAIGPDAPAAATASSSSSSSSSAEDEIASLKRRLEASEREKANLASDLTSAERHIDNLRTAPRFTDDARRLSSELSQTSSTSSLRAPPAANLRRSSGVVVRNTSLAPMWLGTDAFILPQESQVKAPDGRVLGESLTEAQYATRTPEQWGVLAANGHVTIRGVDGEHRDAIEEAQDHETRRLDSARAREANERAQAAQKGVVY